MQVPKRKSEEGAFVPVDPHITQDKFNELAAKLTRMKKSRPALAEEVKTLAQMGDFSENAAYQIAKGKLRSLNERILETEDLLNRAVIIDLTKESGKVQLGCAVTVAVGNKEICYQILGSLETDPGKGIISHNSPIGSALLGKQAGDVVKIKINGREVEYKIIKVE